MVSLHSCNDEARGEEPGHEVSYLQTGKNARRLFSTPTGDLTGGCDSQYPLTF